MNVAVMHPVFWPEARRGAERIAHELAAGLLARGHGARIVTAHAGPPSHDTEDGVPVTRVPRLPERRLARRAFEPHLTHIPFAYAALRAGRDDLAVALHPTDAVAAGRWKARTGRPVVLHYMGIPHRQALANRRLRVEVMQRALASADAVVALSAAAARGFERWLGVEAHVIPPPVDTEAFAPDPAARAPVPTIFCAADPREPRKRAALLLDAFARVRVDLPEARLVLAGPPPSPTPGVEWRDFGTSRTALAAANREAHVAVLPSTGEAFGLVLAEALACGTPVVGAAEGGIPEVLGGDERVGRLFAGDDPAALAAALREALALAADPVTPVHCRARAETFSRERCVDAHLDLYRELAP